jgi:two-component system, NtrC family, sensor kinase
MNRLYLIFEKLTLWGSRVQVRMRQRRDAALRSLRLMLVASIVFPLLLFCFASWSNYRAAFDSADERIDRGLDVASEQVLRVFQSINVLFDSVEQITRGRTNGSLRASEAELSERLKQFTLALPDIASIWILDDQSDAIASSLFFPLPAAVNGPDRAYLKGQLANDAEIRVGDVVRIKMTGRLVFPVSKRRSDSSGTFAGITEISVAPQAIEGYFAGLAAKTSASFALIREDGEILARYPGPTTTDTRRDASNAFSQLIKKSPGGGQYTTVSNVDKIERRFSTRKLDGFPLYVTSSLQKDDIVRGWLWYMASHLIFGVPATLFFVVLILLAMRRTTALFAEAERRELLESSLRQSQKMESVGQLTGGVAHDFNNLLTIILGNLQMSLRQIPEGKLRTTLINAQQGAERAAELTKRLLAFSRSQPLDPKPIDANRLVAGMSDLFDRTLGETISIETVRGGGLWQTEVDGAELESAILNLAINARDAMPAGGKLTIETGNAFLDEHYCETAEGVKPGQYVMISVTDTGSGMSKEVIDKAFEPFFTTKPAGSGTGLGLSQVYGFVKQSGGHIRIYSEVGEGTTVKIYLPRTFAQSKAVSVSATSDKIPTGSQETVLVVEDDPDVRAYVAETLSMLNYRVKQAADAETAINILNDSTSIDLLLTDVVMPGMNGRALANAALQSRPGLKVLYMTGYSRNAIVHQGRLDPGVSLIQKPFSQNVLAQHIRKVLADA